MLSSVQENHNTHNNSENKHTDDDNINDDDDNIKSFDDLEEGEEKEEYYITRYNGDVPKASIEINQTIVSNPIINNNAIVIEDDDNQNNNSDNMITDDDLAIF